MCVFDESNLVDKNETYASVTSKCHFLNPLRADGNDFSLIKNTMKTPRVVVSGNQTLITESNSVRLPSPYRGMGGFPPFVIYSGVEGGVTLHRGSTNLSALKELRVLLVG